MSEEKDIETVERNHPYKVVCAWCGKVLKDGIDPISHGACESCHDKVIREMDKPKMVVMCGSSRFVDIMAVCSWIIERDEKAIVMGLHLLPAWYFKKNGFLTTLQNMRECGDDMDKLHLWKIDLADEIFIVNFDNYIGESTKREIDYAKISGKKIRWFTHDEVGRLVQDLMKTVSQSDVTA